jgi:hypothetical protein
MAPLVITLSGLIVTSGFFSEGVTAGATSVFILFSHPCANCFFGRMLNLAQKIKQPK